MYSSEYDEQGMIIPLEKANVILMATKFEKEKLSFMARFDEKIMVPMHYYWRDDHKIHEDVLQHAHFVEAVMSKERNMNLKVKYFAEKFFLEHDLKRYADLFKESGNIYQRKYIAINERGMVKAFLPATEGLFVDFKRIFKNDEVYYLEHIAGRHLDPETNHFCHQIELLLLAYGLEFGIPTIVTKRLRTFGITNVEAFERIIKKIDVDSETKALFDVGVLYQSKMDAFLQNMQK